MTLTVYTDGGALNNPGPAASAYVIYSEGKIIFQEGVYLGPQTNNYAEYTAVILALEKIKELFFRHSGEQSDSRIDRIDFISDSNLLVNQLNGLFKVKNAGIRELVLKVRVLEQEVNIPVSYTHVLREKNTVADALVKQTLMGLGFRV